MLESLIQYLRAALPQMREAYTNLGRELDMARAFLDIHKVRMGTRPRLCDRRGRAPQVPAPSRR